MADSCLPVYLPSAKSKNSGSSKRKAKNTLPQVLFVVAKRTRVIVGAFVATAAVTTVADLSYLIVAGVVRLKAPVSVSSTDFQKSNGVFKLCSDAERDARVVPTENATTLNQEFSSFAGQSWRCVPLPHSDIDALFGSTPIDFLRVDQSVFKALGVEATCVHDLKEVVPSLDGVTESGSVETYSLPAAPSSSHVDSCPNTFKQVVGNATDANAAIDRLHALAVPTSGGIVTHRFEPATMLKSLLLKSKMKASQTLQSILAVSSWFLFGPDASQSIAEELPRVTLPSDGRLREATVRLELLATLHSRNDSQKHITWRYLNPDSSPQLGWDWLVMREDTFKFSKDIYTCDEELVCADFNQAYDSNTTMLSTLGRGRSQLIKKTFNISMQHKFKASCERDYDSIRHRVYGICSDMGTEKGIAEMSTLTPSVACAGNRYRVADTMMYPAAIYMPEFLHIHF
jgi:hypothetical protein